jgi:branched-chain amino acid transport system ATP-binding protein
MADELLTVRGVSSGYGQILAIRDIDLTVRASEIVSVVGANGAGKSTLLRTIAGLLPARTGRITFAGEDLTAVPAHAMAARGLAMVAEGGRLFPFMTVRENLELGAFHSQARRRRDATLDEVYELFPILRERAGQLAGRLSGGERQMCAVARAVMSLPRLLMLDEPSLGLAPIMVERLFALLRRLVEARGLTVLLVEQNVADALEMCAEGYILERGQVAKSGAGALLAQDPDVQRAYMGF